MESRQLQDSLITEDSVEQMLALAESLRARNGGVLDDSAILAVAEATGAPADYVRLALRLRSEKEKRSLLQNLRAHYLTLEPEVRRYVASGSAAAACGLMDSLGSKFDGGKTSYGIFGMLALVMLAIGMYNASLAKDTKVASIAGAIFGGGFFVSISIFAFVLQLSVHVMPVLLIPMTFGGAAVGLFLQRAVIKYRDKLGIKDPAKDRQDLLRQLVDLQDKLRSGEQRITFLSLDIVGSTKMKTLSDPLSVEFTFTEYHQFVDRIARKWGGSVHSTAGDGVTCAFEDPHAAFLAAKNVQTGIIELNTFRNKIGVPIVLRAGVHSGTVLTPQAGDIKSVNFASVIDIAAHLQKACPPGGIAVSEDASMLMPGGPRAIGNNMIKASEVKAVIWEPRLVSLAESASPPPIPNAIPEMS